MPQPGFRPGCVCCKGRQQEKEEKMVKETYSAEETRQLGKELGEKAFPGQVICLLGDLGTGKTVFTKGFAQGLGITEPVSSMDEIGFDDCIFGDGVSMIEWADLIEEILPPSYTKICIEKDPEKGFDYRKITIERI